MTDYKPLCPACGQPGEQARIDISEPGEPLPRYVGGQQYCTSPSCKPETWTEEVSAGWRWRPRLTNQLTEEERRYLGMHAMYEAARWLDLRTHDALVRHPWSERFANARRWKDIADMLHPEIWGKPNEIAMLAREAEYVRDAD